ncbi:hypothetical protein MFIFM68171_05464 [Madurella fahalii]|uniref:CMP/dCMP-type deaminase domain-containing protein n=1 Tax=Madurella fahalii TaxID=1157608 RepID=A0ABQ0GC54_9PEZI
MTEAETLTVDQELVRLAAEAFKPIPDTNDNHTVAAAVRSKYGETFVAFNVYHFTGGPCAELAVLGTAAAGGVLASEIATIVAVARRPGNVKFIVNPCGRCRQVLLDYNPDINVIYLGGNGNEVVAKAKDLMPFAYTWPDGNTGRNDAASKAAETHS